VYAGPKPQNWDWDTVVDIIIIRASKTTKTKPDQLQLDRHLLFITNGSDGDGEGWRAPRGVAGPGGGVEKGTIHRFNEPIIAIITRPLLPGSGYPMGARRPAAAAESAAMARATTPTAGNDGGWPAAVTA